MMHAFRSMFACAALLTCTVSCSDTESKQAQSDPPRAPNPRWDNALSQPEMNEAAAADLADAQRALESLLKDLRKQAMKAGPRAKQARHLLDASQSAWQRFVDEQIALEWPQGGGEFHGTIEPMCILLRRAELVNSRVKELKSLVDVTDGDVCAPRWSWLLSDP